ncbi:hypothetical protein [Streptomyces durocortorensis]|uniref:XRE family transcriptional regulator n=1 Tax=Streptomyces durocortorensis TaxID=2811104 RepID=A0ABS2I4H8_9ACTN|nr:hypothetical protein [Streptomyces durocortorensis]MBM7058106.1 hypothetical protein [Streptomyces durocortorensis]
MRKLSSDSEVIVEARMTKDDGDGERGPQPVEPVEPPGPDELPRLDSLREKVEYMVEKTFPGQKISGRVFAELVRDRGGSLSHSYFSNILAGKVTQPSEDILKALGLGFGVDWRFFKEESEVVDDVVAGLQFLAKRRTGEISGLAGRGLDDDGLPPELLRFALSLLEDAAREKEGDGVSGGRDSAVHHRPGGPAA